MCYAIFNMPGALPRVQHSHMSLFAILHRQSRTSRVRRDTNMNQVLSLSFTLCSCVLGGCAVYAPLLDRVVERKVRSLSE